MQEWMSRNQDQPDKLALMSKVANQPHGFWFGDWNTDIRTDVDNLLSRAQNYAAAINSYADPAQRKKVLVGLVIYNMYQRDVCSGLSGGGSPAPQAYKNWVDGFTAGIGIRPDLVISIVLEPDALPDMDCMDATQQQIRLDLINYAVQALAAAPNVYTFLDAGNSAWTVADPQHPAWNSVQVMADRLARAGISRAYGFSANVSGFEYLSPTLVYTNDLYETLRTAYSIQIGGATIDTARNGRGPLQDNSTPYPWCNPPGRALGDRPQFELRYKFPILLFWWKPPGESDGGCRPGEPDGGTFMPDYVLGLSSKALW